VDTDPHRRPVDTSVKGSVVVRVEPIGVDVVVPEKTSLMRAAEAMGLKWPTVCGGDAECGTCFVSIDEAVAPCLPPVAPKEEQGLQLVPRWKRQQAGVVVRLACQLRPTSNLIVEKRGVRWRQEGGIDSPAISK
jgi:2Fe-2S ferredoxin